MNAFKKISKLIYSLNKKITNLEYYDIMDIDDVKLLKAKQTKQLVIQFEGKDITSISKKYYHLYFHSNFNRKLYDPYIKYIREIQKDFV